MGLAPLKGKAALLPLLKNVQECEVVPHWMSQRGVSGLCSLLFLTSHWTHCVVRLLMLLSIARILQSPLLLGLVMSLFFLQLLLPHVFVGCGAIFRASFWAIPDVLSAQHRCDDQHLLQTITLAGNLAPLIYDGDCNTERTQNLVADSMTALDRLGSSGKADIFRPRRVMSPKQSMPPKVYS